VKDGQLSITEDGLYHIVYSPDADVITVTQVFFGTRGIGGDWSFSEFVETHEEDAEIFTKTNVHVPTGNFKISVSGGWKIGLVTGNTADHGDGDNIMVNTNFGGTLTFNGNVGTFDLVSGGKEFEVPVANRGFYDFEIKWAKTGGLSAKMTKIADLPPLVDSLYLCGSFADWTWTHEQVITMTPVNARENVFWTMTWFDAGTSFRLNSVRSHVGSFGVYGIPNADGVYELAEQGDVDVEITTAGYYMVFVDVDKQRVFVGAPSVYLIGECSKDRLWVPGVPENKFDITPTGITKATIGAGQLRMYATCPLAPAIIGNDWWRMEFQIFDGKIVYRGNGNDQPRVQVGAGKLVTLDPKFGGVSHIQP
jgi:hypothetical protein